MSTRPATPREYFDKFLNIPEEQIDYGEIPPTPRANWQEAEVLLPLTAEEFQAIKEFIRDRRQQEPGATRHSK